MKQVFLKPGKERSVQRRHPWLYAAAIAKVEGNPAAGDTVAVRAADGKWLAWGAYSPHSLIRVRAWSFDEAEHVDAAMLAVRVRTAVERRTALADVTNAVRLIFGEADGLPGLIVDRYADQLVTQFQGAGVEAERAALLEALVAATGLAQIFDRSDSATRKREGLAPLGGVLRGQEPPERIEIFEHGLRYEVDVRAGHKTGYYVDQRDSRHLARQIAQQFTRENGRQPRVLNCFCYTGGFSIAMLAGGAASVVSIDSSADALIAGRRHVALNHFDEGCTSWLEEDGFTGLRRLKAEGEEFDIIVLDPPKFAASQHHVERAARAYKDINLNALKLLAAGGYLLSFSCSSAMEVDLFQKVVAGAVIDAKVDAWMLQRLGAGADHPLLMTHPEGEYLKGLLLKRIA